MSDLGQSCVFSWIKAVCSVLIMKAIGRARANSHPDTLHGIVSVQVFRLHVVISIDNLLLYFLSQQLIFNPSPYQISSDHPSFYFFNPLYAGIQKLPTSKCRLHPFENVNYWQNFFLKVYDWSKQTGAKIRAHFCGPWSWLQPVCNFEKRADVPVSGIEWVNPECAGKQISTFAKRLNPGPPPN